MVNFGLEELKKCVVKATLNGEDELIIAYLKKYDSTREATKNILIEKIFDECNELTTLTIRAGMSEEIMTCMESTKDNVEIFLNAWNEYVKDMETGG